VTSVRHAARGLNARSARHTQRFDVLGLHHDVPDARTRVVLTPVLGTRRFCSPRFWAAAPFSDPQSDELPLPSRPAAYLGELEASSLRFRCGALARGAFSLSLDSLLSADSLSFEPGLDLPGIAGGPPAPVFNRGGGDRRITGAPAAALHAALRVALGRRGGAQRDALYAPLLAAMTPRREQRG
jgi:hypothetical protein